MHIQYNFDGTTTSFRGGIISLNDSVKRIDTIEIIVNGESVFVNSSSPSNDISLFTFRVSTGNNLALVGEFCQ